MRIPATVRTRARRAPWRAASLMAAGALLALAGGPVATVAQEPEPEAPPGSRPRVAVIGDTIRVGDVVPVAVRVTVERGERVVWPDTLPLAGTEVENAARVRERVDTLEDGRLEVTGLYAVTPWRTGEMPLPELPVQVVGAQETAETRTASLPALSVASVLPEDTTDIEPRPAKGVVGANWALWPFLLALLLLLALVAALVWWIRRRRRSLPAVAPAPPVPPRERALAELRAAREAGLVERGEMKEFYTRVSAAVRHYATALEASWSDDLTTSELLARFRAQIGPTEAERLGQVLRPADQVKFARRRPDSAAAHAEWDRAREWVETFTWPPRAAGIGEAA